MAARITPPQMTPAQLAADPALTSAFALVAGTPRPIWASGQYYAPHGLRSTIQPTADREYAIPLWIPPTCGVDRIGVTVVTTPGGASSVTRLGIREALATGLPGNKILDAGTIATATTGDKEITIDQNLVGPLVFLTCSPQGDTPPTYRNVLTGTHPVGSSNAAAVGAANGAVGYQMTGVTGALPTAFTNAGGATGIPLVWVRAK